jgi:flagellar biosynthetic protein FlhB
MSDLEKTEEPTSRRLSKAREEGQIARSVELSAAAVTLVGIGSIYFLGDFISESLLNLMKSAFRFNKNVIENPLETLITGAVLAVSTFGVFMPIFLGTVVVAFISAIMLGGFNFTVKGVSLRFSKLDPIEGMKRILGQKALVELVKSLAKFILVLSLLLASTYAVFDNLLYLYFPAVSQAVSAGSHIFSRVAIFSASALMIIAFCDVPYQKHSFLKRMRMTKQEIKDELKDIEGRPEVRAQIRRRQREIAQAKMLKRIKDADVIITNPEHFAIALEYDIDSSRPPILVAKGVDSIAFKIREVAERHGIQLFQAPPLARALFFTTELEEPIPEALYRPVAEVIAYIYSIEGKSYRETKQVKKPVPHVPHEYHFTQEGNRENEP